MHAAWQAYGPHTRRAEGVSTVQHTPPTSFPSITTRVGSEAGPKILMSSAKMFTPCSMHRRQVD